MDRPTQSFTVVSEAEAPRPLPFGAGWPEFIGHDPVADRLMPEVKAAFVDHSLVLISDSSEVAAGGWGVPLCWDGSLADLPAGWDGALQRSVDDLHAGRAPNTFCAMATEVVHAWQGRKFSQRVLRALRDNARGRGLDSMIAPTRPTLKARYPLTPIERYAAWTRPDGSPFDPWVRMHTSLGARVIAPAPLSMLIRGTVAEWELWAHMTFPESAEYVVPDALSTLKVDCEQDVAEYIEPAIWVKHP